MKFRPLARSVRYDERTCSEGTSLAIDTLYGKGKRKNLSTTFGSPGPRKGRPVEKIVVLYLDLDRVRQNVLRATDEDLLDRATVYRRGMEAAALDIIDAELAERGYLLRD